MARIPKTEHHRILQMIDGEQRRAAEVAAEYGCTAANIYALLSKLRRAAQSDSKLGIAATNCSEPSLPESKKPAPISGGVDASAPSLPDLFAPDLEALQLAVSATNIDNQCGQTTGELVHLATDIVRTKSPEPLSVSASDVIQELGVPAPVRRTNVTGLPRDGTFRKGGGPSAALAKPGMALMTRIADGEVNSTPFRSLDDLLSAIKPILRTAARSPDAVWFCIQPVDLALLDSDAA